uniref:RB1-inducible coiled-coil protein 1 n=1 Tax=Anopheles coluzzii TaxID=1518534 RepID=A0A8W7Q1T5_ANOCL
LRVDCIGKPGTMMFVFHVDQGRMLTFKMECMFEDIRRLKELIERNHAIPARSIVLLVSGGELLEDDSRACHYATGTDTNPIYMFCKTVGESPLLSPGPIKETEVDLDGLVRKSLELPVTFAGMAARAQLAQRIYEMGREELRRCESLIHEQHLQQQGWAAVVANMEDTIKEFQERCEYFNRYYEEQLRMYEEQMDILHSFDKSLQQLADIPILSSLMENAESRPYGVFDEVFNPSRAGSNTDQQSSSAAGVLVVVVVSGGVILSTSAGGPPPGFEGNPDGDTVSEEGQKVEATGSGTELATVEDGGGEVALTEGERAKGISLLDWISAMEGQLTLKRMAEECRINIEKFNRNLLVNLNDRIEKAVKASQNWASDLACRLMAIHNEEVARRQDFTSIFEGHFLSSLFPGMTDMPPSYAIQAPSVFDSSLPALDKQDLEELSRYLPELTEKIPLPNIASVIDFFQTRSVEQQQLQQQDDGSGAGKDDASVRSKDGATSSSDNAAEQQSGGKESDKYVASSVVGAESETDTEDYEKVQNQSPVGGRSTQEDAPVATVVETCSVATCTEPVETVCAETLTELADRLDKLHDNLRTLEEEKNALACEVRKHRMDTAQLLTCSDGDTVTYVWNPKNSQYNIVQSGEFTYYLHESSYQALGLQPTVRGEQPDTLFGFGTVIHKEFCHARRDDNRYGVPQGACFYRVKLKPDDLSSSRGSGLSAEMAPAPQQPPTAVVTIEMQSSSSSRSGGGGGGGGTLPITTSATAGQLIDSFAQTDHPTPSSTTTSSTTGGMADGSKSPTAASRDMIDSGVVEQQRSSYRERNISITDEEDGVVGSFGIGSTGSIDRIRYQSVCEEDDPADGDDDDDGDLADSAGGGGGSSATLMLLKAFLLLNGDEQ